MTTTTSCTGRLADSRLLPLLVVALIAPAVAEETTVYKHVDPQGRVSYSASPPDEAGKATEIEVDTDQNVITGETRPALQQLEQENRQHWNQQRQSQQRAEVDREQRRTKAEARVRAAEQALEEGEKAQPGDFRGHVDGGVRPSLQRLERLRQLNAELQRAREALESLP